MPRPSPTLIRERRFEPTADFGRLAEADGIIICVPTPLTETREPDLTYVVNTARDRSPHAARPGSSSSWRARPIPGTTRDVVLPILEADGPEVRARTSSSPSAPSARTRATPTSPAATIPKVVGGLDADEPRAGRRALRPGRGRGRAGLQPARSPRRARSWRTPTAPSTSPWSTS